MPGPVRLFSGVERAVAALLQVPAVPLSTNACAPAHVVQLLTELWGGVALPFPPVTGGCWIAGWRGLLAAMGAPVGIPA
jgi:hypothetical protein